MGRLGVCLTGWSMVPAVSSHTTCALCGSPASSGQGHPAAQTAAQVITQTLLLWLRKWRRLMIYSFDPAPKDRPIPRSHS